MFRNISLGGPTTLLISVMPSKSGQAAKRPSSAWIAPGSHVGFSAFSPLESRKACDPEDCYDSYISATSWIETASVSTHLHASPNPTASSGDEILGATIYCHRLHRTFWTGWREMFLPGNVPIGALTLLREAAHFSLRGAIIKLKRHSPAAHRGPQSVSPDVSSKQTILPRLRKENRPMAVPHYLSHPRRGFRP